MTDINYSFLAENMCSNSTSSSITDRILEEIAKQVIKKTAEVVVHQTFETAPYVISYVGESISNNYTYYFGNEESVKDDLYGETVDYTNSCEIV